MADLITLATKLTEGIWLNENEYYEFFGSGKLYIHAFLKKNILLLEKWFNSEGNDILSSVGFTEDAEKSFVENISLLIPNKYKIKEVHYNGKIYSFSGIL